MIYRPMFEPDQDLLVWRKKVTSWVDLISTALEDGQENLYKSVFATLTRKIFDRGLRQNQKSIMDEAREDGTINYRQEDQIKAVQVIVNPIAVDPPIAVMTNLFDSFNKVKKCKRKQNEDLNRFVSRFSGLAAEHIMRFGSVQSSRIQEELAIQLLKKAALPERTLTNAKLQLISFPEGRKNSIKKRPISLSP